MAAEHMPDLILMDIQLPEVSGLDVIKWLKADEALKHIPIIAVTAFAMKGDEEKFAKAAAKRISPSRFRSRISSKPCRSLSTNLARSRRYSNKQKAARWAALVILAARLRRYFIFSSFKEHVLTRSRIVFLELDLVGHFTRGSSSPRSNSRYRRSSRALRERYLI